METCKRCGKTGLTGREGNPEARALRHAKQGLCAGCAATQFLKQGPLASLLQVAAEMETEHAHPLLAPHLQEQFGWLLAAGQSDARPEEIDWPEVVRNWELPFPGQQQSLR